MNYSHHFLLESLKLDHHTSSFSIKLNFKVIAVIAHKLIILAKPVLILSVRLRLLNNVLHTTGKYTF